MLLGFGMSGVANALLYDRGGGLIYDDVLDITWLQNANYGAGSAYDNGSNTTDGRMTWGNAVAWADQLVYQGYDNWRLPDAYNQDGSGPIVGTYVTGSEMGHMFYNNLNGTAYSFCGADFVDGATSEERSFQNLQPYHYWSGTEYGYFPDNAWRFNFLNGYQNLDDKDSYVYYAWAVRDGDSVPGGQNPVPEPTTMLLFGAGLVGLAGFGRKKFKK
jgi:hypothetical protein